MKHTTSAHLLSSSGCLLRVKLQVAKALACDLTGDQPLVKEARLAPAYAQYDAFVVCGVCAVQCQCNQGDHGGGESDDAAAGGGGVVRW